MEMRGCNIENHQLSEILQAVKCVLRSFNAWVVDLRKSVGANCISLGRCLMFKYPNAELSVSLV